MKKMILLTVTVMYSLFLSAQNVGIGTNNPNRAKLELFGSVGATAAIFGGETTGISLQSNFPTIGFNEYYNNAHRYMVSGHAAQQFFDPIIGYMAIDMFASGATNAAATGQKRIMMLTYAGDMTLGNGTARLGINSSPRLGRHNAALQILQTVESDNIGITITDMQDIRTWKISSLNVNDGILSLGLNGMSLGYFDGAGNYITYSDRRLKNDIQTLPAVLDRVMQLRPVQYRMKYNNASGTISTGFIAQEVKELFPELVQVLNDPPGQKDELSNRHALNYTAFGIVAIKAIQEQQALIGELQMKLATLEAEVSGLRGKKELLTLNGHVRKDEQSGKLINIPLDIAKEQ